MLPHSLSSHLPIAQAESLQLSRVLWAKEHPGGELSFLIAPQSNRLLEDLSREAVDAQQREGPKTALPIRTLSFSLSARNRFPCSCEGPRVTLQLTILVFIFHFLFVFPIHSCLIIFSFSFWWYLLVLVLTWIFFILKYALFQTKNFNKIRYHGYYQPKNFHKRKVSFEP